MEGFNKHIHTVITSICVLAIAGLFKYTFVDLDEKLDKKASKGMVLGITNKHEERIQNLENVPKLYEKICAQIEALKENTERLRTLVDKLDARVDAID